MMKTALLAILLGLILASAYAERISQCEWFVGTDPGVGNGTPISVGVAAPQVNLNFTVPTVSLVPGLYLVKTRCRTDTTQRWSMPTPALMLIALGNTVVPQICTQFDWAVDNGTPTVVDVADGQSITLNQIVATSGIAAGLHRLRVRTYDGSGRVSPYTDKLFVVSSTNPVVARQVTQLDYWIDSDAPTTVDVADAPSVNFNQILASASLPIGLHRLNLRARDDLGRIGQATSNIFIVTTPYSPAQPRTITAAEYWINSDPGAGNGVAIPLPTDSVWNSSQENVSTVLTGLPVGLYLVGVRARDNLGRWSASITDSLVVGPVLVISSSGNDIVLNWQAPAASLFKIYRAPLVTGPYALVDSTAAQSYTDVGATNSALRQFYQVTFQTTTLSTFRMPEAKPAQQ